MKQDQADIATSPVPPEPEIPASAGTVPHQPIMVQEVTEHLKLSTQAKIIDGTVGLGGHAAALLHAQPQARLLGIDRDAASLKLAAARLHRYGDRVALRHGNFDELEGLAADWLPVDAILLDLGISSWQLAERGFSFQRDAPLDFRMDVSSGPTAAELVSELPETELADLIYRYGEERASRRIAKALVRARRERPIHTTTELSNLVTMALPRRGRLHPATRTFQALRIAVNGELDSLDGGLRAATAALRSGGRLAVITFHSLEDRIVKQFIKNEEQLLTITKRVVRPTRDEVVTNPRSRSAKLRVAEKVREKGQDPSLRPG